MKRYGLLVSCIILACGLMWSNLALAACTPKKNCKKNVVIAKHAFAEEPGCFERYDCLTASSKRSCDDCIMRMQWKAELKSKDTTCDEARELIPEGSTLHVDLTYHIRSAGPCQTPVGTHEGKFKIYDTAGILIATGTMAGTNGLETHATTAECCDPYHDEGLLKGKFVGDIAKKLKCKKFRATYASSIDPIAESVCHQDYWKHWQLWIDGIVQCRCPRTTTQ